MKNNETRDFAQEKTYSYLEDMRREDGLSAADAGRVEEAVYYVSETSPRKQGEYTIEDYSALPEDVRVELIDGYFIVMDAPNMPHQGVIVEICYQISSFIRKNKGSCIVVPSPVDVQLDCDDRTMVQPDIVILCDRNKMTKKRIVGAPDFVLEVLSPGTSHKDRVLKLHKYRAAGVREYWLLDPDKERLLVYEFAKENQPTVYGLDGKVPVGIYEGRLQIDLGEVLQRGIRFDF